MVHSPFLNVDTLPYSSFLGRRPSPLVPFPTSSKSDVFRCPNFGREYVVWNDLFLTQFGTINGQIFGKEKVR